jgi:hypothetical protein
MTSRQWGHQSLVPLTVQLAVGIIQEAVEVSEYESMNPQTK